MVFYPEALKIILFYTFLPERFRRKELYMQKSYILFSFPCKKDEWDSLLAGVPGSGKFHVVGIMGDSSLKGNC